MLPKTLRLIFVLGVLFTGFWLGQTYQTNRNFQEINQLQSVYRSLKNRLYKLQLENQELQLNSNQVFQINYDTTPYSPGEFGLNVKVLSQTPIETTTYRYRGHTIVKRTLRINDRIGINVWHYMDTFHSKIDDFPLDFAIFEDDENANALFPTLTAFELLKQLKNSTDTYTTKNGIKMVFAYRYTPRTIGKIKLFTYTNQYPIYNEQNPNMYKIIPTIVEIWYSNIDGLLTDPSDPIIVNAKQQLEQIVDQINFTSFKTPHECY